MEVVKTDSFQFYTSKSLAGMLQNAINQITIMSNLQNYTLKYKVVNRFYRSYYKISINKNIKLYLLHLLLIGKQKF